MPWWRIKAQRGREYIDTDVEAPTPGKAKYIAWEECEEPGLKFREFMKMISYCKRTSDLWALLRS